LPPPITRKSSILSDLAAKGVQDKPDKIYRIWVRMCARVIGDRKERA